ncbi:MAG: alpha/beta hydrolase [Deltaproteobacteria bacterium]|nr:alpha/beta hydrolase [Deltaproteobacteria bacterium]
MLISTHKSPGLIVKGHQFEVPLNHEQPDGTTIHVFARELCASDNADRQAPFIVYLQGGPGFECRPPLTRSGWIKTALKNHRVLLLDQRGTGNSTPLCVQTIANISTVQEQAKYMQHFRADSIVKDAELIRKELIGENKWTILGQSFGGFCAVHYLSAAPQGLQAAMITGGLPPLSGHADQVYKATSKRVLSRNKRFYARYPQDINVVRKIVDYLKSHQVVLPGGTHLTPRVFQQLGMGFGRSTGFESLHYLLEYAFVDGLSGSELSYRFLRGVQNQLPFETNPIYTLLHEAIYCQKECSDWSAHRITQQIPDFAVEREPFYFTGEMIYPWMCIDYKELRPFADLATILAQKSDWPILYNEEVLMNNQVPCAALIYDDDMYVERIFSMETAEKIGNMRVWITNEYDHNGLGVDGSVIFEHLYDLIHGNK